MSIEPNRTTLDYLNHPQDFEPEFNFSKYSQDFKAFSTPLSWAVVLSTFIFSLSLLFAKTIDFSDFLRIFISNTLMIVTISYFRNPTIGISLFIIILEDTLKPLNLMHLVFSYVPCMIFCFIACRNIRHWHLTFFFKTCLYFFASSFGLVDVIITYFSIFPVFMVCEKIFRKIYISTEEIIRKNTHCPDFIQIVPLPFAVLDMSFRILANNSAFGDFFDYKLPSSRVFHKLFDPSCQNVLKNLLSKASEKAMGEEEVIVKILNKKLSVIVNAGIGKWGGNDAVFVCVTNASSCEAQKDLMAGAVKLVAESIDDEIENEEISKKNKGKILEFIIRTKDAEILKEYVDGEMNFGVVDFDIVQEVIKIRHSIEVTSCFIQESFSPCSMPRIRSDLYRFSHLIRFLFLWTTHHSNRSSVCSLKARLQEKTDSQAKFSFSFTFSSNQLTDSTLSKYFSRNTSNYINNLYSKILLDFKECSISLCVFYILLNSMQASVSFSSPSPQHYEIVLLINLQLSPNQYEAGGNKTVKLEAMPESLDGTNIFMKQIQRIKNKSSSRKEGKLDEQENF